MDSKPYVRIFSSSSSLPGSFPIRAPPTPDSDSDSDSDSGSNSEINGIKSRYSASTSSGYASAGSENGSEFETASERPLVASDPDEKYELSCPFVDDPDEFELESDRAMPIAQLSWESDDNDVVGSEGDDGGFPGRVRVDGNGFVEKLSIAPRVKVEEGEEDEFLVGEYELNGAEGVEGFISNSDNCVEAEWIEDNGLAAGETSTSMEPDSVELSMVGLEGGEKDKYNCPIGKSDGVDIGVEGDDDLIVTSITCSLPKDEDALCGDLLKSITLNSLSVTVLCENAARSAGAVQFPDGAAYGVKAEIPLEEKGFSIEKEKNSMGLSREKKIHVTAGLTLLEGEEYGSGMLKQSLVIKQSESERTEDSVAVAEINEPSSVGFNINVAEDSIFQCPNGDRDFVDASGSFEALEREMHLGTDLGLGGNENQIREFSGCSRPNPVPEMVSVRNGDMSEATKFDRYEYVVCSKFLHLISPSSNLTHTHIRDETEVKNFKINASSSEVSVTLTGQNVITGLSIEDQMAIGNRLVLAGSVGALQFDGDTADGARLEMHLKDKDLPNRQDRTSLGLSLMKWGGALVLTTDMLCQFSVGSSNMSAHVVLDNKQRGKIAIRASSSNKVQSVLAGILSIAIPIFGILGSRFSVRNSAQ